MSNYTPFGMDAYGGADSKGGDVIKPTNKQETEFSEEVVTTATASLADAITWIGDRLDPADVFDQCQLEEWAHENGWEKLK